MNLNIKNFLALFLTLSSIHVYAMEGESKKVQKKEVKEKKKVKIPSHIKKITITPEKDALVPQGKILKNTIFLNLKSKELLTQFTFEELIEKENKKNLPFVLAMVTTAGGSLNKRTINFYSAISLNNWLKQNSTTNRYNSSTLNYKDLTNSNPIIDIKYFTIIPSLSDSFEYLGSDYDLFMGDKKVNSFMQEYFKAVELEMPVYSAWIGSMYEKGIGVTQDYKKATYWYTRAAKLGYVPAQFYIATMYEEGLGVTKDLNEAFFWLKKAADQDYEGAMFHLGLMYYNGDYVDQDFREAAFWFNKAAEKNHAAGQFYLGSMYEEGLGVTKNLDKAIFWYGKAAEKNFDRAQKKLKELGITQK